MAARPLVSCERASQASVARRDSTKSAVLFNGACSLVVSGLTCAMELPVKMLPSGTTVL